MLSRGLSQTTVGRQKHFLTAQETSRDLQEDDEPDCWTCEALEELISDTSEPLQQPNRSRFVEIVRDVVRQAEEDQE